MFKTTLIAATFVAASSLTAVAGDLSDAGTDDTAIVIIPTDEGTGMRGSLGGAAPAIVGLLLLGAIAAAGGS